MTFESKMKSNQANFKFEADTLRGMHAAAASNQTRLFMEYAVVLIDDLVAYINNIEDRLQDIEKNMKRQSTAKTRAAAEKTAE